MSQRMGFRVDFLLTQRGLTVPAQSGEDLRPAKASPYPGPVSRKRRGKGRTIRPQTGKGGEQPGDGRRRRGKSRGSPRHPGRNPKGEVALKPPLQREKVSSGEGTFTENRAPARVPYVRGGSSPARIRTRIYNPQEPRLRPRGVNRVASSTHPVRPRKKAVACAAHASCPEGVPGGKTVDQGHPPFWAGKGRRRRDERNHGQVSPDGHDGGPGHPRPASLCRRKPG